LGRGYGDDARGSELKHRHVREWTMMSIFFAWRLMAAVVYTERIVGGLRFSDYVVIPRCFAFSV
jgi:hypothetical protein